MAINTSRAERKTHEYFVKNIQTTDTVAPGTYSNTHNEVKVAHGESIAPFSSLQEKVLNPPTHNSAITPGPGSFRGAEKPAHDERSSHGHGHCSMQSNVSRIGPMTPGSTVYKESTAVKNPGPGSYNPKGGQLEADVSKERVLPMRPILEAADKTMPSIPARKRKPTHHKDTSEENSELASINVRHTGEITDRVGPGEYDPAGQEIVGYSAPRPTFFASGMKRDLFEPSVKIDNLIPPRDNPGPGSYDGVLGMSEKRKDDFDEPHKSCQFASKSRMAHQQTINEERVGPGPGRYENAGHIEVQAKSAKDRGTQLGDRANFGSMSARVGAFLDVSQPYTDSWSLHHVPGPGHYNEEDTKKKEAEKVLPSNLKKKIHGVHHPNLIIALQEQQGPLHAFHSTDDRACNKMQEQITPSPTEYVKESVKSNSMSADLKEKAKIGRRGIFGSCADRFYGSAVSGKTGMPDPNSANHGATYSDAYAEPRASFMSQTPRLVDMSGVPEIRRVGNLETPSPGQYMIEAEPSYRSPFRQPRVDHLSFGSGKKRFNPGKDIFSDGHAPGIRNPGPGEYKWTPNDKVKGITNLTSNRGKQTVGCTTTQVGPGSYSQLGSTLAKKTFNVTMDAPGGVASTPKGVMKGSILSAR
jgi:hypothetical protein